MSAKLLRWAALPVTDRRWAAPLSAVALGFGLFAGVAIGPGAAGTFATGAAQIIEIPGLVASADPGDEDGSSPAAVTGGGSGGGGSSTAAEPAPPALVSSEFESEPSATPEASPPKQAAPEPEESEPEKPILAGTVVHVNPAAGSYTLVEPGGTLDVVHAGKAPQPGTTVSVPARALANGTFAEAGTRTRSGTRDRAKLSGIVTYVDPTAAAPAYTVSKRGVSVLVHVHPDPSGAAPELPALGAFATVAVDIEKASPPDSPSEAGPAAPSEPAPALPGPATAEPAPAPPACAAGPSQPPPPAIQPKAILWQRQASAPGAPFASSDFTGIVEAVCADAGKLLISADDIRESGHDLLFTVPETIDTTRLEAGQSVVAMATIAADGSLELTGLASDERTKGAGDEASLQGELVPAKPE
jgi:hypothetical protein